MDTKIDLGARILHPAGSAPTPDEGGGDFTSGDPEAWELLSQETGRHCPWRPAEGAELYSQDMRHQRPLHF